MDAAALKRLKELEAENQKLKEMYADLSLEHKVLKDIVEKSCHSSGAPGSGPVCDRYPSDE